MFYQIRLRSSEKAGGLPSPCWGSCVALSVSPHMHFLNGFDSSDREWSER